MPSRFSATQLFDEPAQQVAPRSTIRTSDPAGSPDRLARISGALSESGNQWLPPDPPHRASPSTSTPQRRTAAPDLAIGSFFYLLSFGLVAAATVAILFGVGFSSLGHPAGKMIARFANPDRGNEAGPPLVGGFAYSAGAAVPAPVETELPRSVAAVVLPAFSGAQDLAEHEAFPPETGDARQFAAREAPGSATGGAPSTLKVPGSRSTTHKAHAKPVHTIPAPRSMGRAATLTPPAETGPARRSTGRDATLTPPTQSGPMLK
jgi:hypothetical protein